MASSLLFWGVLYILLKCAWGGGDTYVGFVMLQHVEDGKEFKIVRSSKDLGEWDISKGISMTYQSQDLWTASIKVEDNGGGDDDDYRSFDFKVVVVSSENKDTPLCSMPGSNRAVKIPKDDDDKSKSYSIYFVHVIWDEDSCPTSCSFSDACSKDKKTTYTSVADIHKAN